MNQLIKKIKFLLAKKPVVIIIGEGKKVTKAMISCILEEKNSLIFESEEKKLKEFKFFLEKAFFSTLVITHFTDIPFDKDFFASEKEKIKDVIEIIKSLPYKTWLVLNYDDETIREIKELVNLRALTFGFSQEADFFASDLKFDRGINFKVNHKGKIVPFWLKDTFGKEQIYGALAAVCVGNLFNLNLVEISQKLRNYQPLPGKMRLLEGIKGSFILDDTESATIFSMIEALEILGKIPDFRRKIAVLGDVIGAGKYTIEAHERIGEFAAKNADYLFTFGERAKFIGKGAFEKGMNENQIYSFSTIKEGIEKLKKIIKNGDLILVDGSKELKMSQIVDEIRKIW